MRSAQDRARRHTQRWKTKRQYRKYKRTTYTTRHAADSLARLETAGSAQNTTRARKRSRGSTNASTEPGSRLFWTPASGEDRAGSHFAFRLGMTASQRHATAGKPRRDRSIETDAFRWEPGGNAEAETRAQTIYACANHIFR